MGVFKRFFAVVLLCAICLCASGAARPDYQTARMGGLVSVNASIVSDSGTTWVLPDVTCRLYHIADLNGKFDLKFDGYHLRFSNAAALADALDAIIIRDGISPDCIGVTDIHGTARFDGLMPGVWLLRAGDSQIDNAIYHSQPSLFHVRDGENLSIEIKHVVEYIDEPDEPVTIQKVLKRWDDNNYENRPEYIYVELLRNGSVYDRVKLSDRNNWRHTWTGLNKYARWSVIEVDVPDGYEFDVSRTGVTTVITNSRVPDEPEIPEIPEKPEKPEKPGQPDEPEIPETPEEPEKPEIPEIPGIPETPGKPKIPQTGTTWWLVPCLAGSGLILILAGSAFVRRGRERDGGCSDE